MYITLDVLACSIKCCSGTIGVLSQFTVLSPGALVLSELLSLHSGVNMGHFAIEILDRHRCEIEATTKTPAYTSISVPIEVPIDERGHNMCLLSSAIEAISFDPRRSRSPSEHDRVRVRFRVRVGLGWDSPSWRSMF